MAHSSLIDPPIKGLVFGGNTHAERCVQSASDGRGVLPRAPLHVAREINMMRAPMHPHLKPENRVLDLVSKNQRTDANRLAPHGAMRCRVH